MDQSRPSNLRILVRGLRKLCPKCGQGKLFASWYTLNEKCEACHLDHAATDGNTWAFIYITSAFLTGLFIVAMLLLLPAEVWMARVVTLPVTLVVIVGSLPRRKGIAVAIEFLIDRKMAEGDQADD